MVAKLDLVTTADVGEALGVSEQTVRTWCRLGVIPALRPPGTRKWLISAADFDVWLRHGSGAGIAGFLDPSHRSQATETELLADGRSTLASAKIPAKRARRKSA